MGCQPYLLPKRMRKFGLGDILWHRAISFKQISSVFWFDWDPSLTPHRKSTAWNLAPSSSHNFSSLGKTFFRRIFRSSFMSEKVELTNTRKILVCCGIVYLFCCSNYVVNKVLQFSISYLLIIQVFNPLPFSNLIFSGF